MKAEVCCAAEHEEFLTPERCWITEVANDAGDESASVALARVPPRTTTKWHRLEGVAERYLVVSGRGRVELGEDVAAEVSPGDVVRIPPNVRQRIANTGDEDLVVYCVCTPRFEQAHHVALEP